MKILHIINDLNSGGAQKLLEDLIPIIKETQDIQVEIFLLSGLKNVFYESLIKSGVEIKTSRYKNIYDPRNIMEINKYIKAGTYDIVHAHLFPTQYWLALSTLFNKNPKTKFVSTEHNTYNRRRKYLFFRPIDRLIYSRYDLIVSVSKKTKENLLKWVDPKGEKLEKHIVIENGIDLAKIENASIYNKADFASNIEKDTKLVCMVGRFTDQKDYPTLIRAISKLGENIHLILAGEGELQSFNEKLAEDLAIGHRVHFLGFRSDVPQMLKAVDIVVLSSYWEGLPLAALEGMAAAKPLIASNVEGLAEVVDGYGLTFEKGNYQELATLISRLTEDEHLYNEISAKCKRRAQDFSIEKTAKNLLEAYRAI